VIAVVGAGSWGTALTIHLARTGAPIRLWAREPGDRLMASGPGGGNPVYIARLRPAARVEATGDIAAAVDGAEVIVMVVPSEFFAATLASVPVRRDTIIVSATKVFDPVRHARMSELVRERFPQRGVAALSGPTFACARWRWQPDGGRDRRRRRRAHGDAAGQARRARLSALRQPRHRRRRGGRRPQERRRAGPRASPTASASARTRAPRW